MSDGNFKRIAPPLKSTSKKDKKRQMILHCAATLFNEHGSQGTTLREITKQLGLTKTSLYYYIKNKDDLAYKCYLESCTRYSELIEAAAHNTDGSFLARLYTDFMDFWADVLTLKRPAITFLSETLALKEPMRSDIIQRYISLVLRIRDVLKRDMEAGVSKSHDPLATAHAFFSTLQWIPAWLKPDRLPELEALKKAAYDILRHGICNRQHILSDIAFKTAASKEGPLFTRQMSKDEKLEAFLREATRQFNSKGFNGTSIDEIAEKLNVTKGAFYYHFKDKRELLELCCRRGIRQGNAAVKFAKQNAPDGLDRFSFALGFMFVVQNSKEGPFANAGLLHVLDQQEREKMLAEISVLSNTMGTFLKEGVSDSSIRPVNIFVAQSILMGVVLCGDNYGSWREINDMKESARHYLEGLITGTLATN